MEQSIDKGKQYSLNPRTISDKELNRLEDHLLKFGDLGGVVYCRNNKAYVGGNQRSKIFDGAEIEIIEQFDTPREDKTIAVGFITWNDRKYMYREVVFTEEEFKEACIIANSDSGEWDLDILKDNWLVDDLEEWGFDVELLTDDLSGIELSEEKSDNDNPYTRKVESPVYIPSEVCPDISDLYTNDKTNELLDRINAANIPEDIKQFLVLAAYRHTIFFYDKIADFYAHSSDEVKSLMEDSALVIVDFNKSIDLGYVKLSEEIREQYKEEHGD